MGCSSSKPADTAAPSPPSRPSNSASVPSRPAPSPAPSSAQAPSLSPARQSANDDNVDGSPKKEKIDNTRKEGDSMGTTETASTTGAVASSLGEFSSIL